jgi:hypothetical protein
VWNARIIPLGVMVQQPRRNGSGHVPGRDVSVLRKTDANWLWIRLRVRLRNKHPKRWVTAKLREDRQEAVGPKKVWAMDFVHDQLANPRTLPNLGGKTGLKSAMTRPQTSARSIRQKTVPKVLFLVTLRKKPLRVDSSAID